MIDLSFYAQKLDKKNVAVFGLGLSGLAAIKALISADISVTAWDDNQDNRDKAEVLGAVIFDLTQADLSVFDFLLLAPGVPYSFEPHAVVVNAQKHNLEIIGDLELLHRSGHEVKTIGITGTNGKSTTTALMAHILNECGVKTIMGGNIGKAVMDLDISDNIDVLVLEISSYQMDLCPTYRPDVSMLLNITPDHLDRHGSMDDYVGAKQKILEGQGVAIVSVDDDFTMKAFDSAFCQGIRKVIPVSVHSTIPEGVFVKDGYLIENKYGEDVKVGSLGGLETLRGLHNQQNAAFTYVAAKTFSLEDSAVFKAFATYAGLPHRQYLVTQNNNVSYINDSKATNAEAAAKALSSYDNIFWIVGGKPKNGGLKGLEIFKDKIKKSYLIGEATEEFSGWFKEYGFEFSVFEALNEATEAAYQDSKDTESPATVLLSPACASWDQFSSFEVRGDVFTDKVLELVSCRK